MNTTELFFHVRRHHYTWPGGYPMFALMDDCEVLCVKCLSDRSNPLHVGGDNDGWRFTGADVNWEDPDLYCAHCSDRIESAYAD